MKLRPAWWMLAGLAALAVATAAAPDDDPDRIVELPPMVIEESGLLPPWLYARAGNVEYLSRCSARTTRAYAEMQRERLQWLHALFPVEFFAHFDVPETRLLVSQKLNSSSRAEVVGQVMKTRQLRGRAGYVRATIAPNMMLNDIDDIGVFAYIDERNFRADRLTLSTDYVRFLLARRVPALPPWLLEGIVAVYNDIDFNARAITLRPLTWRSEPLSRRLARDPGAPRTLLPAGEFFSDPLRRPTRDAIARGQCALLLRWALDPRNGVREAFWRFAARAAEAPVTAEMFESYFGFGFSDLRDRLSDYLPLAVADPLRLLPERAPDEPEIEVRRATPAEIGRLRGEWERLTVPMVQALFPDEATRYRDQARRTLQKAYGEGVRDPRLLAILGLCEIDAGNAAGARAFLERAVAGKVVRPRAGYELARLRWAELVRGRPATQEFDAAEIVPVLDPLRGALAQAPLLHEAVALAAEAWLRYRPPAPAAELAGLARAGTTLAGDARVCLLVARALGRHGRTNEAVTLLRAGFPHVEDDATRAEFAQLFEALTKPGAANSGK